MTIQEMIKEFNIKLDMKGREFKEYPATGRVAVIDIPSGRINCRNVRTQEQRDMIIANKAAIFEYLMAERNAALKADEEREEKIGAIEGLKEIKDALRELEDWSDAWENSFSKDFGGQGVGPKPNHDIKAMLQKYPRAAAYLEAEKEIFKHTWYYSEAGKKARERIINEPENYSEAIAEMRATIEKENKEWVLNH